MPDLTIRSTLPEKMDAPGVPERETRQALRELETVNEWLGGYNVVLGALEKLIWPQRDEVHIMDMGCGGGDMLRAIARWAKRKGRIVKLTGVDRNPVMVDYAAQKSKAYENIRFIACDVFDEQLLGEQVHITTASLFCHHFDGDDLIRLVSRMYQLAQHAVVINDLHRHWIAYHSIRLLTMGFSKTYLVKYDAPLSVARSFSREDWEQTLTQAGIKSYTLEWKWAWRWELIIHKK